MSFTVDGNWIKFEKSCLIVPKSLTMELKTYLNSELRSIKQVLLSNVSGSILNRRTGKLARTIKSRVRTFNNGNTVWGRVGSKYYIGRFWEGGMTRKGKSIPAREWAGPTIKAATFKVAAQMDQIVTKVFERSWI